MEDSIVVTEILKMLDSCPPSSRERLLMDCVKASRLRRYNNRSYDYPQLWKPVLRAGYGQYVVSNWGYVRHVAKSDDRILKPSLEHQYARAPLSAAHRDNGATQHMIHELVWESFVLGYPIPKEFKQTKTSADSIINHLDGDKWNPAIHNLELTDQGKNMEHAYESSLRQPRGK